MIIAPANAAPPSVPAYNLPDLKRVEDDQTALNSRVSPGTQSSAKAGHGKSLVDFCFSHCEAYGC